MALFLLACAPLSWLFAEAGFLQQGPRLPVAPDPALRFTLLGPHPEGACF